MALYGTRRLVSALICAAALASAADLPSITLNDKEYFEAPGFSFLVFHNNYQVGYQGGLQMIENGERVLDSGDLLIIPKAGRAEFNQSVLRRTVDRANASATVFGEVSELGGYRLISRADGSRMVIKLALDRPI